MSAKRLSIALIALLALTPLLTSTAPAPVLAQVEQPEVSIDYPYIHTTDDIGARTITVKNPEGNPDIIEIRVSIGADVVEDVTDVDWEGFVVGTTFAILTEAPWLIVSATPDAYDFILPGGGVGKIILSLDPRDAEMEDGVVDKFTITVTVKFRDGTTVVKTVDLYCGRSRIVTVSLSATEIIAGEPVDITVQTGPLYMEDEGLPLVVWTVDPDGNKIKVAEVVTGADGKAKVEDYKPTKAGDWTFYANVIMSEELGIGAELGVVEATLEVKPGKPVKVVVKTPFDKDGYAVSWLTESEFEITVSVTDEYNNPVVMEANCTVTLSAAKGELVATETYIPPGSDTSMPVIYKPDPVYGATVIIYATVDVPAPEEYEGTYSGSSKTLKTSTFATEVVVSPTSPMDVEAGDSITILIDIDQENVPVSFEIVEGYKGSVNPISVITNKDGEASTTLYVSTKAGDKSKVKAIVMKPLTDKPDNTISGESAEITTIPAEVAKLGVSVSPSEIGPGKKATVTVYLADEYDNEVPENIFGAAIRVDLTVTGGTLERDYVYIPADATSTTLEYTAPSVLGTYTITATTIQYGLGSGSTTVEVLSLEPIVEITDPAEDVTEYATEDITRHIAGWAKPSDAAPPGTVIVEIKYSLNGAENITVPILKVEEGKFYFNFSVVLTVNVTHTITVYVMDTEGYEASATRTITVSAIPPPPVIPIEITEPGVSKPEFLPGEEVKIWATVTNVDVETKTVIIRITFTDPTGVPQYPIYEIEIALEPGESVTPTATFLAGVTKGAWKAKIMVVDAVTGEPIAEPVELTVTVV